MEMDQLWFERFRLLSVKPIHESADSIIYEAIDESADLGEAKKVALKLLRRKQKFIHEALGRQKSFRESMDFRKSSHLVGIIDTYPSVHDAESLDTFPETIEIDSFGNIDKFPCIVMPLTDRNLHTAMKLERFAGSSGVKTSFMEVKRLFAHIVDGTKNLHRVNIIHGNIKPTNIVRLHDNWMLIDLDAAVEIGSAAVSTASSSGYMPPEAIHFDQARGRCYLRTQEGLHDGGVSATDSLPLIAHPSFDVWSLGCVLYSLCDATCRPLFMGDQDDRISHDTDDQDNIFHLLHWDEAMRSRKLSKVPDRSAKNLISLMLHEDPARRLTIDKLLQHPFMTGSSAVRFPGEECMYDVYLCYRIESDYAHAKVIADTLTERGISVYWKNGATSTDKQSDDPDADAGGASLEDKLAAMVNSKSVVCLLSRDAINHSSREAYNFGQYYSDSVCDDMLAEFTFALELKELHYLESIFPVMIGDITESVSSDGSLVSIVGNYFADGCLPRAPGCVVESVEDAIVSMKEKCGVTGISLCAERTVSAIVSAITLFPGAILHGELTNALVNAVNDVSGMVAELRENAESVSSLSPRSQSPIAKIMRGAFKNGSPIHDGYDLSHNSSARVSDNTRGLTRRFSTKNRMSGQYTPMSTGQYTPMSAMSGMGTPFSLAGLEVEGQSELADEVRALKNQLLQNDLKMSSQFQKLFDKGEELKQMRTIAYSKKEESSRRRRSLKTQSTTLKSLKASEFLSPTERALEFKRSSGVSPLRRYNSERRSDTGSSFRESLTGMGGAKPFALSKSTSVRSVSSTNSPGRNQDAHTGSEKEVLKALLNTNSAHSNSNLSVPSVRSSGESSIYAERLTMPMTSTGSPGSPSSSRGKASNLRYKSSNSIGDGSTSSHNLSQHCTTDIISEDICIGNVTKTRGSSLSSSRGKKTVRILRDSDLKGSADILDDGLGASKDTLDSNHQIKTGLGLRSGFIIETSDTSKDMERRPGNVSKATEGPEISSGLKVPVERTPSDGDDSISMEDGRDSLMERGTSMSDTPLRGRENLLGDRQDFLHSQSDDDSFDGGFDERSTTRRALRGASIADCVEVGEEQDYDAIPDHLADVMRPSDFDLGEADLGVMPDLATSSHHGMSVAYKNNKNDNNNNNNNNDTNDNDSNGEKFDHLIVEVDPSNGVDYNAINDTNMLRKRIAELEAREAMWSQDVSHKDELIYAQEDENKYLVSTLEALEDENGILKEQIAQLAQQMSSQANQLAQQAVSFLSQLKQMQEQAVLLEKKEEENRQMKVMLQTLRGSFQSNDSRSEVATDVDGDGDGDDYVPKPSSLGSVSAAADDVEFAQRVSDVPPEAPKDRRSEVQFPMQTPTQPTSSNGVAFEPIGKPKRGKSVHMAALPPGPDYEARSPPPGPDYGSRNSSQKNKTTGSSIQSIWSATEGYEDPDLVSPDGERGSGSSASGEDASKEGRGTDAWRGTDVTRNSRVDSGGAARMDRLPATMSGFLNKEGQLFKTFKRRFFRLEKGVLSYYDANNGTEKLGDDVLLEGFTVTSLSQRRIMLSKWTAGKSRQILLEADNEGEYSRWLAAFQEHVQYLQKHDATPSKVEKVKNFRRKTKKFLSMRLG